MNKLQTDKYKDRELVCGICTLALGKLPMVLVFYAGWLTGYNRWITAPVSPTGPLKQWASQFSLYAYICLSLRAWFCSQQNLIYTNEQIS